MRSLLGSRVAFVSGKGGVGKTTVAAALAIAAAKRGERVLLAEVEDRDGLAPFFGLESLGLEERTVGSRLRAISIRPDESLVDYLRHFYGIPRLSRALVQSRAVEFATQVAPGLRDILLVGKIKEAEVRRTADRRPVFDRIIVDSPPTGRLPMFLDAPRAITDLVRSGPVGRQAEGVRQMLADPRRAQIILVTLPEELPIQETLQAVQALRAIGVAIGPVVCNAVWTVPGTLGDEEALRSAAVSDGTSDANAKRFAEVVARAAHRSEGHQAQIRELASGAGEEPIALPFLFTPEVSRGDLDELARVLDASGRIA